MVDNLSGEDELNFKFQSDKTFWHFRAFKRPLAIMIRAIFGVWNWVHEAFHFTWQAFQR